MEFTWYQVELTDFAKTVFTKSFLPEIKDGKRYVWITDISYTPNNAKLLVASRPKENSLKMVTKNLGAFCFKAPQPALKEDEDKLNILLKSVKRNL